MESRTLAPVRRHRRTLEQWRELLDCFEHSGQTQEQFCTAHDLGLSTFGRWRKRLRRQAATVPKSATDALFIELAQAEPAVSVQGWDVELQLGAGVCLRLRRTGC